MDHRRIHRRFTSEMDEERDSSRGRSIKAQERFNVILGIIALLIFIIFAFDIGGWATDLGVLITGNP